MTRTPTTCSIPLASDVLGISRTHGYALARSGEFPGLVKLGKTYRVSIGGLAQALSLSPEAVQKALDELIGQGFED